MSPADPVLVGCAHGTKDPAGRRALAQLRLQIAALRPGLTVLAASVDVQKPGLDDVVARLSAAGQRCVVVPLLLSAGYHVAVDVARAVAASGGLAVAASALGPDDALAQVLAQRLDEAGSGPRDEVVLGAAGSTDPRAVADVEAVAGLLAARRGAPVATAYLSAATPGIAEAVAAARARLLSRTPAPHLSSIDSTDSTNSAGETGGAGETGSPGVAVATYLLAPGFFADRLAGCAADRVSAPLGAHPLLADLALRRYDQALATVA